MLALFIHAIYRHFIVRQYALMRTHDIQSVPKKAPFEITFLGHPEYVTQKKQLLLPSTKDHFAGIILGLYVRDKNNIIYILLTTLRSTMKIVF